MIKRLIAILALAFIIINTQSVNAEVVLKNRNERYSIGSYSYNKYALLSSINLVKYFSLDRPNEKARYFISIFLTTNKANFDLAALNKGDAVSFIFSNDKVTSVKEMYILNKGLTEKDTITWLSLVPSDDFPEYILPSNKITIEFVKNEKKLSIPLTDQHVSEWKQVVTTITKVKEE